MSQQDLQILRSGSEAFNRGDIPAVIRELLDSRIEWYEPGGGRAPAGTFQGSQQVADDVFSTIPQHFDDFRADPEQFIDAGDHVVVVGHFHGHAKHGTPVDVPFAHVWEMRNGKATHFENLVESGGWISAWGG